MIATKEPVIFVDADACPVKSEVIKVAGRHGLQVTFVANSGLRPSRDPMVRNVVVSAGFDAADDWIVETATPGDIAITADVPLAVRLVEKDVHTLGPTGRVFDKSTIGMSSAMRDLNQHLREAGEIRGYNAPFSQRDRSRFLEALEQTIRRAKRAATGASAETGHTIHQNRTHQALSMKTVSTAKSHGGVQGVYSHASQACGCEMTFAVFLPPQAENIPCPVVWYLSGLTCTHQNAMDKGEYRRMAAELGLIVVCPDTSPRGDAVPDEPDSWQFGKGAGFYVDATEAPYSTNYRMYSYVNDELPNLVAKHFPADMNRQSVLGHSMGGHGALVQALRNPDRFKACSAFAPIVQPSTAGWSKGAMEKYLGADRTAWRNYDACALVADGCRFPEFLIDQGTADGFLDEGLRPWLFEDACAKAGITLTLNMREGYDHSYFFISTFMDDHLRWHAKRLG